MLRVLSSLGDRASLTAVGMVLGTALAGTSFRSAVEPAAAETLLKAFGRANPQCQFWSDWRMTCARTGPGGSTACREDPERAVTPSQPFCMVENGGDRAWENDSAQRASVDRFCSAHNVETTRTDPASGITTTDRACSRFEPTRPFNGRRIGARRHPWCQEWSDADTLRPVCSERTGPRRGAPSCAALAQRRYQHRGALYCSRWLAPSWCGSPRSFYDPRQDGGVIARGAASPDWIAVFGVFCERTD